MYTYPGQMNISAIRKAMKPGEKIVCTNATVIADKQGEVTGWFDNDKAVCVIEAEEET